MTLKVNMHSHLLLAETMNTFPPYGPKVVEEPDGTLGYQVGQYKIVFGDHVRDPRFTDGAARIADMNERGTDIMGVTVSPMNYLYWAPPEIGDAFSKLQNDGMRRFCSADPDRLFFFATVPLQDIPAAVKEFDRAVSELGARGLNIGQTDIAIGKMADDEYLFPLYEKAQELDVPLFVHPYPPGMATGKTENLLDWMAGYVHQSTVTGASMLMGGVFDVFPRLKVVLPHGGGALPYQFGRFEYAARRMRGAKAKRNLYDYLENLYFDCLVHNSKARQFLIDFAGPGHVVVGDNYLGWDAVDGFAMVGELGLPKDAEAKIFGDNAVKLFKLSNERRAAAI
jgi:aminocarboxymuconate-semialdehyde decarboxylase